MEIDNVKGKENVVVDTLSRWRHVATATSMAIDLHSRNFLQLPHDSFYIVAGAEIESQRPLSGDFMDFH
ncbi:hypothetical protein KI387_043713 [Taxus chinensis]|uniref:Uncharacterized protein n=1 Tax=Taxus chinensis TaxID=29808 RepID=A0AA38H2W4_TAXCH|nr:hypothetical protein KI387_043713 [Taxus chinensis]